VRFETTSGTLRRLTISLRLRQRERHVALLSSAMMTMNNPLVT
jgi:hypothetical protein